MAESALAPEVSQQNFRDVWDFPDVVDIAEQPYDVLDRISAARFIGSVAVENSLERTTAISYNLHDAVREAARGNLEAYEMVRANVSADVVERTLKSGHITETTLQTDANGTILQHGQSIEDVQSNSLRFASSDARIRERTNAEVTNAFRQQTAYAAGQLNENYFVVLSPAIDTMTEAEATEVGFFATTMSLAIQVTTVDEGELKLQSAFVAGKRDRKALRHDLSTVAAMGDVLGVDFGDKTAVEILNQPILIPKSIMPNGVVDLVKLYDDNAGGTFFGESQPRQNYLAYQEICEKRELAFEPQVDAITDELIASSRLISSPMSASQLLNELSAKYMLERAVNDDSIDSEVFGVQAAFRIEQARHFIDIGDIENAELSTQAAHKVEKSSSCPGGVNQQNKARDPDNADESSSKETSGDCDFTSKKCPVCGEKDAKTRVRKGVYYHVGKGCRG